jgi:hypothetical protein
MPNAKKLVMNERGNLSTIPQLTSVADSGDRKTYEDGSDKGKDKDGLGDSH